MDIDDLRRVREGALLLGEGDLGDAGEVAQVHDALEVVVVGRHRALEQREEVRQAEVVGGGRCWRRAAAESSFRNFCLRPPPGGDLKP